jgi:hypothetical protein
MPFSLSILGKKQIILITPMKIAYYITSHGFGHGIRSCAIANNLSLQTGVVFRTALPKPFFEEETTRPFSYDPASFDCGCVQTDGVTVDIEKTLDAYRSLAEKNAGLLSREVAWCESMGIDGIVSDIVPFAFEVASAAGIPSVAVTNFTWYDIYREYCVAFPGFMPMLEKIKADYASAGLLLALQPHLPMDYFPRSKRVAPVGRIGADIRKNLRAFYGLAADKHIGLIYTGTFGMDSIPWKNLERFAGWEFLGLYPLPGAPGNYHVTKKNDFRYQDIIASADCVISKVGYGVCAECMLNGIPLIYLPRMEFAEYPVLEAAIVSWGGGHRLSGGEYCSLAWDGALGAMLSGPRPRPCPSGGALDCAREIESFIK